MKNRLQASLLLSMLCSMTAFCQQPFGKDVRRILFIGNSITYNGRYIVDIEAYCIRNFPNETYEFINVGLPSETVSGLSEEGHAGGSFPRPDLHERLQRVLDTVKPDMVLACYGMNDGIYKPFDKARFKAFKKGMDWLHQSLAEAGISRIVHITPPVYDDRLTRTKGYNEVLDKYADWLLSQRKNRQWEVADVHFPMTEYVEEQLLKDSTFRFAKDGVHPEEAGHWFMARIILQYLGLQANADEARALRPTETDQKIFELIMKRQNIMKDAWLSACGHQRPGMPAGIKLVDAMKTYHSIEKEIAALKSANKQE